MTPVSLLAFRLGKTSSDRSVRDNARSGVFFHIIGRSFEVPVNDLVFRTSWLAVPPNKNLDAKWNADATAVHSRLALFDDFISALHGITPILG